MQKLLWLGGMALVTSFLRTIILYFVIIICLRLTGKRQMGDLEPSELVVTIMISELAAVPMQDIGIPILSGVIPILTLVSLELLLSALSYKSVGLRALLCGRPTIVVEKGQVIQKNMKKTRLTLDELNECLRKHGVTDLTTVRFAVMETDGQLSVIQEAGDSPPSAKVLKVQPPDVELPMIIINDGQLVNHNLEALGLDKSWVNRLLEAYGVSSHEQVYLLSSDNKGNILFIKKEAT